MHGGCGPALRRFGPRANQMPIASQATWVLEYRCRKEWVRYCQNPAARMRNTIGVDTLGSGNNRSGDRGSVAAAQRAGTGSEECRWLSERARIEFWKSFSCVWGGGGRAVAHSAGRCVFLVCIMYASYRRHDSRIAPVLGSALQHR
jgi:hypothetical protein